MADYAFLEWSNCGPQLPTISYSSQLQKQWVEFTADLCAYTAAHTDRMATDCKVRHDMYRRTILLHAVMGVTFACKYHISC